MLAGIEGKDLRTKFILGIDLGVLEGQISGGLISDSIFDPSVIGASVRSLTYLVTKTLNIWGISLHSNKSALGD